MTELIFGDGAAACSDRSATRTNPLKAWPRAVLCVAALALANGLHAAGLFLPVHPIGGMANIQPIAKPGPDGNGASALPQPWERRVRIDRYALGAARDDVEIGGTGRLLLNMSEDVHLGVAVDRTAPTGWGYSLSGRVVGEHVGFVTLVVHEEAVAGHVWTPDASYELSYLGEGLHALRDASAPVECGGASSSELAEAASTVREGTEDDGSVVDILVVWTPAAEDLVGGEPQTLSEVDMHVAFTNDAFDRSGAFVSLNLVGAEKVDYLEAVGGSTADMVALSTLGDGQMDGVHARRDALGADLVYLLVSGGIGLASAPYFVSPVRGRSIFAHEVGHGFGVGHERKRQSDWANIIPGTYDHGFVVRTQGCERTIMAYGTECGAGGAGFLPFYASPWRYHPRHGGALGVPSFSKVRGPRGPADAVLELNRNRHRVADFRPERSGVGR